MFIPKVIFNQSLTFVLPDLSIFMGRFGKMTNGYGDKLETCPVCHKEMLSHDLAQINQCMKGFIKKLFGKTFFDTWKIKT